ncbi:MAG: flagellar hook protein FlgE [Bryobacteraceae bacterium]|nr:flagellar hook protein FlgE [Bryobacteraceae bacterium]
MFTAFSTALSALGAHSTGVDVVANNLANLNTAGFKASGLAFYDLVSEAYGQGNTQVGFGVSRPITIRQFTQGAIQNSNGPLDAAIQGDGFLIVRTPADGLLYTRGGSMTVDREGNLLTGKGLQVQGWTEKNGTLNASGPIGPIVVPVGTIRPPKATTSFNFDMNLNAAAKVGPPPDTFNTSIQVFDSLGTPIVATVNLVKSATPNAWDYSISVPDSAVASPVTPVTGTLTFDADGKLTTPTVTDPMPSLAITGLLNGAQPMNLTWNLYNVSTPRVTQFAATSAVAANSQDGNPASQLTQVRLADGGKVVAIYSNGQQQIVGQLAMAAIRNPDSLVAVGDNNFQLSSRSALPAIGEPNTGSRGSVIGNAIESSTVDIAREFTNLIVLQRAYQANTRVVTTMDEISQETINLKR